MRNVRSIQKIVSMFLLFTLVINMIPWSLVSAAQVQSEAPTTTPKPTPNPDQIQRSRSLTPVESEGVDPILSDGSENDRSHFVNTDLIPSEEVKPLARKQAVRYQNKTWKQVAAFYDPSLFELLTDAEKREMLKWDAAKVDRIVQKMPAADKKTLRIYIPSASDAVDYHTDRFEYIKNRRSIYPPDTTKRNKVSGVSIQAAKSANFIPGNTLNYANEFNYQVNGDALVDGLYRSANREVVDVSLSGKSGLDVSLVRRYNSMDSQAIDYQGDWTPSTSTAPLPTPGARSKEEMTNSFIANGWTLNIPEVEYDEGAEGWVQSETLPGTMTCSLQNNLCAPYFPSGAAQTSGYVTVYENKDNQLFDVGPYPGNPAIKYRKVTFKLDSGQSYEFREYVTPTPSGTPSPTPVGATPTPTPLRFYPYHQAYQNAELMMTAGGNFELTLNKSVTYVFVKPTTTNKYRIQQIRNVDNASVTYDFNDTASDKDITITDSYGRTILIYRKSYDCLFQTNTTGTPTPTPTSCPKVDALTRNAAQGIITGIDVFDQGKVVKRIRYSVTKHQDSVLLRWNSATPSTKSIAYWTLDRVTNGTDDATPITLESYNYYDVDSTKLSDYLLTHGNQMYYSSDESGNMSCAATNCLPIWKWDTTTNQKFESKRIVEATTSSFLEMPYVLLKDVQFYNGLTARFNYTNYSPSWASYPKISQQQLYRGTTRLYTDRYALEYISYHPVERVDFLYTSSNNWMKSSSYRNLITDHGWPIQEYWHMDLKNNARLSETSRTPERQTIATTEQVGATQNTTYRQFGLVRQVAVDRTTMRSYDVDVAYVLRFSWNAVSNANSYTSNSYSTLSDVTEYVYTTPTPSVNATSTPNNRVTYGEPQPNRVERYVAVVSDAMYPDQSGPSAAARVSESYEYDNWGRQISYVDARGVVTKHEYQQDSENPRQLLKAQSIEQPVPVPSATPFVRFKESYDYYTNSEKPAYADELESVTAQQWYPDPEQPTSAVATRMQTVTYGAYNSDRLVTQQTEYGTDEDGSPELTTNHLFTYTNRGFLSQHTTYAKLSASDSTAPVSLTMTYGYDLRGNQTKSSYPDGSQLNTTYDALDRVTQQEFFPASSPSPTPLSRLTIVSYNDNLRTVTVKLPDGEFQTTYYSPFGLAMKTIRKVNQAARVMSVAMSQDGELVSGVKPYNDITQLTETNYDSLGRIKSVKNPVGHVVTYQYANAHYVGSYQQPEPATFITKPDGSTELTQWNRYGQVVSVMKTTGSNATQDLKIRTVSYEYDTLGYVSKMTEHDGNSASTSTDRVTTYKRDSTGQLLQLTDATGRVYRYSYDRQGQLLRYAQNGQEQQLNRYNELGWLLSSTNQDGKSDTNTYDINGLVHDTVDRNKNTKVFTYTSYYEPKQIEIKNNQNVALQRQEFTYDSNTRQLTQLTNIIKPSEEPSRVENNETISYRYDQWKRLNSQRVAGKTYSFSYDNNDRMTKLVYPETGNFPAMTVSMTYDNINRPLTVQASATNAVNAKATYTYPSPSANMNQVILDYNQAQSTLMPLQVTTVDGFGELKSVVHAKPTATPLTGVTPTPTPVNTPTPTPSLYLETEKYDPFGNITNISRNRTGDITETNRLFTYGYDNLNRVTSELQIVMGNSVSNPTPTPQVLSSMTYLYDEQGNRSQMTWNMPVAAQDLTKQYRYNPLNQLEGLIDSSTSPQTQSQYTYYADGLRAIQTVNGTKTRYVNLSGDVIDELDASGNVAARNVWGEKLLFRIVSIPTGFKTGYYYYNGHGDVVRVLDANGNPIKEYNYDIWGNVTDKKERDPNFTNPFQYTGEQYDENSGLIYLRARYYDPEEGRFLTEDTYKGQVDNPLSLNWYGYVENSPLVFIDPSGQNGEELNRPWENYLNRPRDSASLNHEMEKWEAQRAEELGKNISEGLSIVAGAFSSQESDHITPQETAWSAPSDVIFNTDIKQIDDWNTTIKAAQTIFLDENSVIWKNGYRTPDGRFASPTGPGRSGAYAEQQVWDSIKKKPGWTIIAAHVKVTDEFGNSRFYDGVAISPRGRGIGIEVKSGSARKTPSQRRFDSYLNNNKSVVYLTKGQYKNIVIRRNVTIRGE